MEVTNSLPQSVPADGRRTKFQDKLVKGVQQSASSLSLFTTSTTSTKASGRTTGTETKVDITTFRELPSFDAFTKVGWLMVAFEAIAGVFGAVLSYTQSFGALGGIMSGIVGLWFIQMSWIMSFPSKTSSMPYYVALAMLPFNKSVGFLLVNDPDGNFCDWREFLTRMAILSTMWTGPMYLAGRNTSEIVRCIHGDVSRYDPDGEREKGNLFAVRRRSGEELDEEGIKIRERAMSCTVKYLFVFPLVVYITFYAIGAIIEAMEYVEYTTMEGDSFEIQTGKQVSGWEDICNYEVPFISAAISNPSSRVVTTTVFC